MQGIYEGCLRAQSDRALSETALEREFYNGSKVGLVAIAQHTISDPVTSGQ